MDKKETFKKMLLDDSYITWLSEFMKDKKEVDNLSFTCNPETKISCNDIEKLGYLSCLFVELLKCFLKNNDIVCKGTYICLKYKNRFYLLERVWECYYLEVYDNRLYFDKNNGKCYLSECWDHLEPLPYVEYEELKTQYSLEEKANANNIKTTNLDEIINKIVDSPRDFYVKVCNSLTPEERLFIIKVLENKNCLNCTNTFCRVEYKEKVGFDENGNQQGSKCIGWHNEELIGKSKILRLTDINKLK